ncbi:MAG: hypothetical protein D6786_03615 [Gammaproteobacteria bacterium]|nr:MAG: hypothetical protein D6786_03615 [Gammaproteobacteria bacterium]
MEGRRSLPGILLSLMLLGGCEQPDLTGLNLVAYVDTGPLGRNALLIEQCIEEVPHYLLLSTVRTGKPGSRGALAVRYRPDGSVPACRQGQKPPEKPFVVRMGKRLPPNLELGDVCLFGVRYHYLRSNALSGLAAALDPQGGVQSCSN